VTASFPIRLLEPFASGAAACVHFGWLAPARFVAVKRLHSHVAHDELLLARVALHARLAMSVDHPNVVATLAVVRRPGELLAAMEYVPGASLEEIGAVALEPGVACAVVGDALRGLAALHATRGAPRWRTFSPASVLVGEDGQTRVIDLDVPLPRSAPARALVDKLPYTAPERLEHGRLDARGDVYAAAVILWETLTGRPLFHAPTASELVRRVREGEAPATGIDPDLDAIVLRGLARDPDARFESAIAMARELERFRAPASDVARALDAMDLACVRRRRAHAESVLHSECSLVTPKP
jgi:serine/threonine-protein kinase